MKNSLIFGCITGGLLLGVLAACSESPANNENPLVSDTTRTDPDTTDTCKKNHVYHVSTGSGFDGLTDLQPGDTVVMLDGLWTDQKVVFKGTGTEKLPVVLMPQSENGVILTGQSALSICGDYLQVEGLVFKNGSVSGNVIEFRAGNVPSNHCRLTKVTIEDYSPDNKDTDSKWVSLFGTYNRVDHCSFSGKTNKGATFVVWMDENPDYHLIDHNYFGPRPELGENGGETIRIGTSSWVSYESNTIVEYNLFEECDGEVEIISNKSVGNHYRYNTFRNCLGTLTLRHGSYCKVYGNFFFGDPAKNSGGVRIIGEGHEVYNNYFEGLNGTSYRAVICLVNGEENPANSGYVQVTKAKIGFNTIVDCKQPFAIGAGVNDEKVLPPDETLVANNLVKGREGYALVQDYDVTTGITWASNYVDVDDLGIGPVEGIYNTTLVLQRKNELYRPAPECICIGAANPEVMEQILDDIDGQSRSSVLKDVGCDEVNDGEILIYPLTKEDLL